MGKSRNIQNKELGDAMRELRQGSRTSKHRNRAKYRRADWRNTAQRGMVEIGRAHV